MWMAIDLDWKEADRLLKQVLQILPREAAQALDGMNAAQVEEIRLRCGQVPSILRRGVEQPLLHCGRTPQQELQRTLLAASAQSQYAVQEQLREGFLSVPGGVRIGVCGSAYFEQNLAGAIDAGLDVGVYFFSQAMDEQEAREEARFVLDKISGYQLAYPVFFDWEKIGADARSDAMDLTSLTTVTDTFCSEIEAGTSRKSPASAASATPRGCGGRKSHGRSSPPPDA